MVTVQKDNIIYDIDEKYLELYLSRGYKITGYIEDESSPDCCKPITVIDGGTF